MGRRFYQAIYECSICGRTPEDGEKMWWMGNETWCEACIDKVDKEEDEEEETDDSWSDDQEMGTKD